MKLFFKFLWMGISKGLMNLLFILPILVGGIVGWILSKSNSFNLVMVCVIAIILLGYWILFTILHSVSATKYCKEHNTDSLKEAWSKTSW